MAPLHTASKKGDLAGVRAALAAGADVNGKDSVRVWRQVAREGACGRVGPAAECA
jgi:hypothetical protein